MKNLRCVTLATLGCTLALSLCAEEEAAEKAEASETPVEGVPTQKAEPEKVFHLLPFCRVMEGGAEVMRPGSQAWEPLEEGKFYPLGCSYRTTDARSRLTMQFGSASEVQIEGVAAFGTRVQPVGQKDRTVILKSGTIKVVLPRNMAAGLFNVTSPGFAASNMSGESSFTYAGTGDGDQATVRCVTGSISVEGRHFSIPQMRAANELKIRTSLDLLFTGLYGTSGDYVVQLDQGDVSVHDVETGEDKIENRKLDWHLSPQTAVRIHRARPSVGERMAVTIMTFDESGELVNRCAFTERRPELNTGEQGEKALAAREARAQRAMESADAVTTEAPAEEKASTEENKENTTEESTEE